MLETLNFQKQGLITYFQDPWVLKNASIADNILTILSGGTAEVYITDGINEDFKYLKCSITFKSNSITDSNNYQTNPTLYIKEVYKNTDNKAYRGKTRALCFNNFTKLEENYYKDETILETLNKPLYSFYIKIANNTKNTLYIKELQFYKSLDISESQTKSIVETLNSKGQAQSINVNHNEDNTLNGLEFQLSSGYLYKVKPYFYDGQLISVGTNYGMDISVNHFIKDTDLTTTT